MKKDNKEKLMQIGEQGREIVLNFEYNKDKLMFIAKEQIEGVSGCKVTNRTHQEWKDLTGFLTELTGFLLQAGQGFRPSKV